MSKEITKTLNFNGEEWTFTTGRLTPRADASILAQVGETVVLTVVTVDDRESDLDYFPLSVEYMERFYAGGVISGSRFMKREMRPSDDAVLKARQIDHSIRSLFPKGFKRSVNVIVNVMAYDDEHDPEILAVTSASMALMLSSIPFEGPSASVKVGIKGEELVLNPAEAMEEELDADFIVSARGDRILNIEGYGDEIPESKMGELMDYAVAQMQPLLEVQKEFQKEVGKEKFEFEALPVPQALIDDVDKLYHARIEEGLYDRDKRSDIYAEITDEYMEEKINAEEPEYTRGQVNEAIEYVARKIMRKGVLEAEKRTSGRKLDEVRELGIEVGYLPRVHGSGLFERGQTQALSIVTLGSTRLVQTMESYEGESEKHFMHHYNGPNYSFGQAGRFNYYPGRREIGHGNIGENALRKMMPSLEDFPYTTRVASEVLSQRGSSSMAATCGATLALMDAGVPIKQPVAGISVGLVTEDGNESNFKLLTDMEDVEDFYGDMDFKVTGTKNGVTAMQLDNKLMGVPVEVLKQGMEKARAARVMILDEMSKVISGPRAELSKYAPKVETVMVKPDKIGEIIGPGGKMIKKIVEEAGGEIDIDIDDDGQVNITGGTDEQRQIAIQMINDIAEEPEEGKIYNGTIDKVMNYGAFVDVSNSISGLIHVSELKDGFVKDPNEVVKEGDKVRVKLIKIENGKLSFSLKGVEQNAKEN